MVAEGECQRRSLPGKYGWLDMKLGIKNGKGPWMDPAAPGPGGRNAESRAVL